MEMSIPRFANMALDDHDDRLEVLRQCWHDQVAETRKTQSRLARRTDVQAKHWCSFGGVEMPAIVKEGLDIIEKD